MEACGTHKAMISLIPFALAALMTLSIKMLSPFFPYRKCVRRTEVLQSARPRVDCRRAAGPGLVVVAIGRGHLVEAPAKCR